MDELTTRTAVSSDLPAIIELHAATIAELAAMAPAGYAAGLRQPPAGDELADYFAEALSSDSIFLTAEAQGSFAGYLLAEVEEYGDDLLTAPYLTLTFIEVPPAARRTGAAVALIGEMERVARERGLTQVDLRVWQSNPAAIALYEKLGYWTLERRMTKSLG